MRKRTFLLGLLLLAAIMLPIPTKAIPKIWWADCFQVVGRDLSGVSHEASFYHRQMAHKLAAAWVAAGWTGVTISLC